MRQKAMEADIVIVNHHLFFADLAIRKSETPPEFCRTTAPSFSTKRTNWKTSPRSISASMSATSGLPSSSAMRSVLREIETEVEDLSGVQRASDYFFNTLALMGDGRHLIKDFQGLAGMDSLIGALRDARRELKKQEDFSGMWETLARRAGELVSELEVFRSGTLENYVSWIERRGRGVFLEACPIDVSGMLQERLFERIPSCVLTSATLTVGESFEFFRQRIGMEAGASFRCPPSSTSARKR